MQDTFHICFDDLSAECQAQLLEFMGVESASDLNWDIPDFPLAIIEKPDSGDED